MKRVANNVALETVLYCTNGLQKIRVLDREHIDDPNPKLIFEGLEKDFAYNTDNWKYRKSAVRRVAAQDDCLVFTIQTKYEEY